VDIFTDDIAKQAIEMNGDYIRNLLDYYSERRKPSLFVAFANPVTGTIAATAGFGHKPERYEEIATAKTLETHREKISTAEILIRPHLLRHGDTVFWGSAYLYGLSVGASGDEPYNDELVSHVVAATGLMLCKKKFEEIQAQDSRHFI